MAAETNLKMDTLSLKEWLQGLDCPGMQDALEDQVRAPHPLSYVHANARCARPLALVLTHQPGGAGVRDGRVYAAAGRGWDRADG